jgi:hypothetical protein
MGWDYVSELWPALGQLFIPQLIDERGEPWWSDVDRGKLQIRPPECSQWTQQQSHLVANQEDLGKGNDVFGLWSILIILHKSFLTCRKILWRGASGFTSPPNEGVLRIFISLKNPSPWPGLNLQTLGPMASTVTITPPRQLLRIIQES